ncbi:hypothetical protein GOB91_30395 [Sinorhizobium meliloti]|nr:hypothetical protein [Sinorhizobium meliloti]MDW9521337.1 hypothetical protein [Sinorhizobium meliloti]MDW9573231.1 hypothetical protein [Sinorhizobium meliloti]MDW9633705.1 hypothetical protein [Sinorhizobium meliloti]MDW9726554.1 hypothetical protein [Sinorhizobium meliloti]
MGEASRDGKPCALFLELLSSVPLLHVSFNPIRLKDKNMLQIKVLQRPLRV